MRHRWPWIRGRGRKRERGSLVVVQRSPGGIPAINLWLSVPCPELFKNSGDNVPNGGPLDFSVLRARRTCMTYQASCEVWRTTPRMRDPHVFQQPSRTLLTPQQRPCLFAIRQCAVDVSGPVAIRQRPREIAQRQPDSLLLVQQPFKPLDS